MPSHILGIIKKENSIQELDDHSVATIKAQRYTSGSACTKESVVLELACGRVSKFLLVGSNRMLVV